MAHTSTEAQEMPVSHENLNNQNTTIRMSSHPDQPDRPLIRKYPSIQPAKFAEPSSNPPPQTDPDLTSNEATHFSTPPIHKIMSKYHHRPKPIIQKHKSFKFSTPLNNRHRRSLYREKDPLWRVLREKPASTRRVVALWNRQRAEQKKKDLEKMGRAREELGAEIGSWFAAGVKGGSGRK